MPDGEELKDVHDLRRYAVSRLDDFSYGLAVKLLTYASGHPLSYATKLELRQIGQQQRGKGFADLLVELVSSPVFRHP